MSHVHTNAVAIFLVGEAAIRCLETHEYLQFNLVQQGQTANSSQKLYFGCLNSRSHFLIHDTTLMATSQNRNIDRSEERELCLGAKLPFQYHRSVELAHYCTCFSDADIQFAILSAITCE